MDTQKEGSVLDVSRHMIALRGGGVVRAFSLGTGRVALDPPVTEVRLAQVAEGRVTLGPDGFMIGLG